MLIVVWSPKGGVGTSVVAASLAAVLSRSQPDVRLVDSGGDLPAVCGARLDIRYGFDDLIDSDSEISPLALDAVTHDIHEGFRVLPVSRERWAHVNIASPRGLALATVMARSLSTFVLDAGTFATTTTTNAAELLAIAPCSLMVLRPCFLGLQRVSARGELLDRTSGVVLIDEPHRALGVRDVHAVLHRSVVAQIPVRPEIARAIDAGMLLRREPTEVFRPLQLAARRLGLLALQESVA